MRRNVVHFSIPLCQDRPESLHCGHVYTKTLLFLLRTWISTPSRQQLFLKYIPSFPQTVPVKTSPDFNSVKNVSISLKLCLIIGNVPRPQILWYLYMAYSSEVTAPTFLKNSEISAYSELQQWIVCPQLIKRAWEKNWKYKNKVTTNTSGEKDQPRRKEMSSAHKKMESFKEINIPVTQRKASSVSQTQNKITFCILFLGIFLILLLLPTLAGCRFQNL